MLPVATADRWRARSVDNLVARARQTGCWVAAADVTGTAGDLISFGCTAIVAPDGKLVAAGAGRRGGRGAFRDRVTACAGSPVTPRRRCVPG